MEALLRAGYEGGDAIFRVPKTFTSQSGSSDDFVTIRAFRNILCAHSGYFAGMFRPGGMKESAPGSIVTLDFTDEATLRSFLRWIHACDQDVDYHSMDIAELTRLLRLADRLVAPEEVEGVISDYLISRLQAPGDVLDFLGEVFRDGAAAPPVFEKHLA